ncbi:MAG: hypothetical protein LBD21_05395 [Tannerellaceae bacterium]|jgi:DNA-binding SARP family transcriptional activator|nr:hypothetical protein [Tannerellaceae bacterium]
MNAIKSMKILAVLLIAFALQAKAEDAWGGLYFRSFEVNKDSRTRLQLTPDRPMSLPGGFTLRFDFKIRPEHEVFGYIFRIIGNEKTNIDLISNSTQYDNIVLVVDNRTFIEFSLNELPAPTTQWTQAVITVDTRRERLEFTLGDLQKSATCDNISGLNKFDIHFGGNDHPVFGTSDVAPFLLRDLELEGARNNRPLLFWKLSRHRADAVYDEYENARAAVTNAAWEINRHSQWEKLRTLEIDSRYPKIAFNRNRKEAYIVGRESIYIYNMAADRVEVMPFRQGLPLNIEPNQMFYDAESDCLIMYEFDTQKVITFSFATQSWSNTDGRIQPPPRYRHHNKWYDRRTGRAYMLGGYGFHLYSALLQSFDGRNQWESVDLADDFPPRYLAAMGEYADSLLLCFGGYGSVSGRQHEAPHNYYDLYVLNPATRTIRKLWELASVDEAFANAGSLIVNRSARAFYTLSYPNNVYETRATLHEYQIDAPGYRKLANAIPFLFNDEESFGDLFMPQDSSAIYAALSNSTPTGSVLNFYSIAYPPLSVDDTLQAAPAEPWSDVLSKYLAVLAPALVIIAAGIAVVLKKRRSKSALEPVEAETDTVPEMPDSIAGPAINLLNNFRALDAQGGDVTHLFSPTSTQIFLLIYFKTVYDKTGITSNELQQMFWPDKDYESAQNNRNVYFTKLRSVLSSMGNVRIDRLNNFWVLAYDARKIHSDYTQVMHNLRRMQNKDGAGKDLLRETLRLINKGKLLPFLKADWLDHYKTDYANTIIESLTQISEHPGIRNDNQLLLQVADAILMQDEIEEFGIRLKCSVLYKLGKKQQAMQCYDKYAETYQALLDVQPNFSFREVRKGGLGEA